MSDKPASPVTAAVEGIGQGVLDAIESLGAWSQLLVLSFIRFFSRPFRLRLFLEHMEFIGVGSVLLVCMTGLFTGMVFAKQSLYAFGLFNAQSLVGPTVALTLTRELAPVFTALMVTMRAGSSISTELGTMRVTEQIDALGTLAVDPLQYLLAPRIVAASLVVPLLTVLFNVVGLGGAYAIVVFAEGMSPGTFLARVQSMVEPFDMVQSVIKGCVFGTVVTLIACHQGFHASGGAKGVGRATTRAMVLSAEAIFFLNFVLDVVLGRVREGL